MSYAEQNKQLTMEFNQLLIDYKRYYLNYKLNQENSFLRLEANLKANQQKVISLGRTIEEADIIINKKIKVSERILMKSKKINTNLNIQDQNLDTLDKASLQLLQDQTQIYETIKMDIVNNIVGIGSLGFIYFTQFHSK